MAVCIVCGGKAQHCLCPSCSEKTDIEKLAYEVIRYKPETGQNSLWNGIAGSLKKTGNFKNIAYSLADGLPSPKKEYLKILTIAGDSENVPKQSRPWLYETYDALKKTDGLTREEKNRVRGLVLGALYMDYRYEEADNLAGRLLEQTEVPAMAYYNLADFFLKTRRYDEAADAIQSARTLYGTDSDVSVALDRLWAQNEKYREAEKKGKKEYMPNPRENRDAVRKTYVDFLTSIGIEAELPAPTGGGYVAKDGKRSSYPVPIPKDQYPSVKETREAGLDNFVAYDFETTGFSTVIDSIIEVGAIKVVNGEIVETGEFIFQELVKPFKRRIHPKITGITGIKQEDVQEARQMWEVTPDFAKFIGDNVLVGFNNINFDSRFLARAGRYSNMIIDNPQFDVYRYVSGMKEELGLEDKVTLGALADKLGVENPRAHRALADAITTAKIYLKLKEKKLGDQGSEMDIDDFLADLEDW